MDGLNYSAPGPRGGGCLPTTTQTLPSPVTLIRTTRTRVHNLAVPATLPRFTSLAPPSPGLQPPQDPCQDPSNSRLEAPTHLVELVHQRPAPLAGRRLPDCGRGGWQQQQQQQH